MKIIYSFIYIVAIFKEVKRISRDGNRILIIRLSNFLSFSFSKNRLS